MLNCKLRSTLAAGIKDLYFTRCDGNRQVAEFRLHNIFFMKSKFRASNTLLNSGEYAFTRKEHFSFLFINILPGHSNSEVPKSSLSNKNTVCAPAERAKPGPSLPLSVLLLSGGQTQCHIRLREEKSDWSFFYWPGKTEKGHKKVGALRTC